MLKIYGDIFSGNCYKIKLLASFLQLPHQWQHVDILKGESREPDFLRCNPNGKVPCVRLSNGEYLWESNAILHYLADGTKYLPVDKLAHARVLQWQFFEQYSHEPFIATARYINKYLGLPEAKRAEYESKQPAGHRALAVMDKHLAAVNYFVGEKLTVADISLFAYTHVAEEGGFALAGYPHILAWIERIQSHPGFHSMQEFSQQISENSD